MPYAKVSELPDSTKGLPAHGKEIYMKAFNASFKATKGEEPRAHATAWSAVEKSYKKVGETWVAISKESRNLSDENKRNLLQTALAAQYGAQPKSPIPKSLTVEEVFDEELIYNIDGQLYQSSYELGEAGELTFGEPKKVMSTKIFKPLESLQATYSEIIQEAGKRNANLDSTRLKQIMALCQELLSSEAPDEDKAKEAVKKASSALTWLKEQEPMKTEDGEKYPAVAFAYIAETDKASTWNLRLWEDPEKKVTRAQLGRVAAALSPGGLDGQKVVIPTECLTDVKRIVRSSYRNLGVDIEDMPRWIKESETREKVNSYVPLTEAKFDKGRATIIIIKPGFNLSEDRYYPAEMLKRDYKVFEGQKMYADHPTESEDKERPERSIKDWVATLSEVMADEAGVVTGIAEIVEPWLMQKLASLRDKKMLAEMGISINAVGRATKGTIEGKETLVIEELTGARSVDFVTEPGAGGIVTFYETDKRRDIDLVELATLKEIRPDLVKAIEATVRAEIQREVKKVMENEERITELEGQNETLTTENTGLKDQIAEAAKMKAKAEAQASIKEAVAGATLPEAAKERLIERYKDAETADGIAAAIQSEVDYIAKLAEAGKVKGLGPSRNSDPEKDREALTESFKKLGLSEKEAEIAAVGR